MPFSITSKEDLTDREIFAFWHCVREAGRDSLFFWDRERPLTDAEFAAEIRDAGTLFFMVKYDCIPVGCAWLDNIRGRAADIHFCLLPMGGVRRTPEGEPMQIAAGKELLEHVFSRRDRTGRQRFETLTGKTPSCYDSALKYALRIGGKICGRIPAGAYFAAEHENADLVITQYSR